MTTNHGTPIPTGAVGQITSSTMLPSILRTVVPLIYAALVHWGVVAWLGINDRAANSAITVVITALFYIAIRVLERYQSQIGWLLGYAQQPVYVAGQVLSVIDTPTPPTTTTTVQTDKDPGKST